MPETMTPTTHVSVTRLAGHIGAGRPEQAAVRRYWSPARTDVMRWVLKPSQCIRPT